MPTVPGTERVPGRCHYIIMKVTGHCSVGSDLGTKIHCFPGMATGTEAWRGAGSEVVADRVSGGRGAE